MTLTPAVTIKRKQGKNEYTSLTEAMIEKSQALSGDHWTDYNAHDPGVTIIEQLAYGLTDVNLRSRYSAEQLLTDNNNTIDLNQHGLFSKNQALRTRPVTREDKQKYFLNELPELAYIDFNVVELNSEGVSQRWPNMSDVVVKTIHQIPDNKVGIDKKEKIVEKIKSLFESTRNLGERLQSVTFIEDVPCEIKVSVVCKAHVNPNDILGELLFRTQCFLLGSMYDAHEQNAELAPQYRGPRLGRYMISDQQLYDARHDRPLNKLIGKILEIDGVAEVEDLTIVKPNGENRHVLPAVIKETLRLKSIKKLDFSHLRLVAGGRELALDYDAVINKYETLESQYQHRISVSNIRHDKRIKSKKYKHIAPFTSVQAQFPDCYGINQHGIPRHGGLPRRIQALQLKGYLLLCDQMMSDHTMMLEKAKTLFSTSLSDGYSYPSQALSSESVPEVDKIYKSLPESNFQINTPFYEDFIDRKIRVIEYLCAINGVDKFTFGFEYRNPYFSSYEIREKILNDKIRLLENIHLYSENKSGAANTNIGSMVTSNVSYLEKKIQTILGVPVGRRLLALDTGLSEKGASKSATRDRLLGSAPTQTEIEADIKIRRFSNYQIKQAENRFIPVPYKSTSVTSETLLHTIVSLGDSKEINQILIKNGSLQKNYALAKINNKNMFDLFIRQDDNEWCYLCSYAKRDIAVSAINVLRNTIQNNHLLSEGMYLIEHVNLLPDVYDSDNIKAVIKQNNFFQYQISIVLPSWTPRFSNNEFQRYVEDLIRSEVPAHLYANIRWLNYESMKEFEIHYVENNNAALYQWLYENNDIVKAENA